MTKTQKTLKLGENVVRYKVLLTDEPSSDPILIRNRRVEFLREIINDGVYQGFINCGPEPFKTLEMYHNGIAWIVEMTSEEQKGVSNG